MPKSKTTQPGVLIVGAGVTGAVAAQLLANAGCAVTVVERDATTGGYAAKYGCKATDVCLRCNVCVAQDWLKQAFAESNDNIRVLTNAQLTSLQPGDSAHGYQATVSVGREREVEVAADAVLVCTGFEPYKPAHDGPYSYGLLPNVISGLDLEQQLTGDRQLPMRPSDGTPPGKVAFIQCVGSRNQQVHRSPDETNYCSTVCCPYALRMGRLLKHLEPELEITVFYMDIQCFGRDFPQFFADCQQEMQFIKARPFELTDAGDGQVQVKYEEQTTCQTAAADFDLVVLAIGMRPPTDIRALADTLNLPLDEFGFAGQNFSLPPGILVAGASEAPKDIAQSISQAKAAVSAIVRQVGIR